MDQILVNNIQVKFEESGQLIIRVPGADTDQGTEEALDNLAEVEQYLQTHGIAFEASRREWLNGTRTDTIVVPLFLFDMLEWLSRLVVRHWPFDREEYPHLPQDTHGAWLFALQHIAAHQAKAVGNIYAVLEPMDHGRPYDYEKMKLALRNLLINTLRLAAIAGISVEELERAIWGWAADKQKP